MVLCFSLSNSVILNFQWVPGHVGTTGKKHADSLPKDKTFLATAMVPCSSTQLLPKLVTSSVTNGDVTFPHSPSHLNCPISTVSPLELVVSRSICFELSAFASKVQASYNCRTGKSVVRKTLPAAFVDTFYRTLIIFFLTVWPLSFYANLSLALQSAPWRVAQLLGLCEVPLHLHPSEWVGWHYHSIKPLQKYNNAVCFTDC